MLVALVAGVFFLCAFCLAATELSSINSAMTIPVVFVLTLTAIALLNALLLRIRRKRASRGKAENAAGLVVALMLAGATFWILPSEQSIAPSRFVFRDAELRTDLEGATTFATTSPGKRPTASTAYVAPVLPKDYEGEDVLAWAVKRDQEPWPTASGGTRASGPFVSNYDDAIADAETVHHLHSAPNPLLLHWTADPDADEKAFWRHLAALAALLCTVWVGLVALLAAFSPKLPDSL